MIAEWPFPLHSLRSSGRFHGAEPQPEPTIRSLSRIPLNKTDIPQSVLNIESRSRTNLLPWKGQFSPQLIHALLEMYGRGNTRVLDPFAGSGTTLVESSRLEMSSVGAEVNPAAAILARVYEWVNRARSDRQEALRTVGRDVDRLCAVAEAAQFGENGPVVSTRRVAEMALTMETETRQLFEALLVLSDPTSESVDVGRFIAAWKRLREVLLGLPYSDRPVKVFDADARELPIADGTIDLVVTSPPYINVFNYHQQYRPAVEALGFDVLIAARSEIGSNRKHRSNRFLTAIQYCLDLSQVLGELKRVCAVGSRMILVLGRESRVRGTAIQNGDLLCSLATDAAGLGIITRQERCFTNRYGERIVEDILHFRSNAEPMTCDLETPRQIAVEALERAVLTAPAEASEDIAQAIEFASTVEPSPRYRSPTLRHNRVAPIDANPHASLG